MWEQNGREKGTGLGKVCKPVLELGHLKHNGVINWHTAHKANGADSVVFFQITIEVYSQILPEVVTSYQQM